MRSVPNLISNRLHYGWVIAGLTFMVLLAAAGVLSASSVLIVALEQTFGWSSATVSTAIAVNLLFFGVTGLFAVVLIERFGVKPVITGLTPKRQCVHRHKHPQEETFLFSHCCQRQFIAHFLSSAMMVNACPSHVTPL